MKITKVDKFGTYSVEIIFEIESNKQSDVSLLKEYVPIEREYKADDAFMEMDRAPRTQKYKML